MTDRQIFAYWCRIWDLHAPAWDHERSCRYCISGYEIRCGFHRARDREESLALQS